MQGPEGIPARTRGALIAPFLFSSPLATATALPGATRPPTPSLTRTSSAPSGQILTSMTARNALKKYFGDIESGLPSECDSSEVF